jgi:hypothetical protein
LAFCRRIAKPAHIAFKGIIQKRRQPCPVYRPYVCWTNASQQKPFMRGGLD